MFWPAIIVAAGVALAWVMPLVDALLNIRQIADLQKIPADESNNLPPVSIVFAARDEAATIEPALQSMLNINYPSLEIVAVDDRSQDATGEILDRLAASNSRLRVVHITELPAGWLGKNNALHLGANAASGDFILFTDADVHLDPSIFRRAIPWMESEGIDHLVVGADVLARGWLERAVFGFFMAIFLIKFRPWRVADPHSPAHIGIGAFNFVRTDLYRRAGGHAPLRMDVLDDVKLGKLMKQNGASSRFAHAGDFVRVRWAEGIGGLVRGLEKNAFAGFEFNPVYLIGGTVGVLLMTWWPWIGLASGPYAVRLISGIALLAMFIYGWLFSPEPRGGIAHVFGFPIAGVVMAVTIVRSMRTTLKQGGINWRGTIYRLDELKKGIY